MYSPDLETFSGMIKGAGLVPLHRTIVADLDTPLTIFAKVAGNEKHAFELEAAGSLILGTDYAGAREILEALPLTRLNQPNLQHYDINRAEIAVREQHPDKALAILQVIPLSGPFVGDIHRLRAEAYLQNKQFFSSARERIQLDPLLTDPEKQLENEFLIWTTLNNLTDTELQTLRRAPPPDPVSGWIELVELSRLYLQQPDVLKEVTPHWQKRYPDHPANLRFIDQLLGTMRVAGQPPANLALLLPLKGSFSDAANAIRDGLFAAYYDSPDSAMHPQLRLYDTGNTGNSVELFNGAASAGSQVVMSIKLDGSVHINLADTGIDFAGNNFGYYLDATTANQGIFYSDTLLNGDSTDHMLAYQGTGDTVQIANNAAGRKRRPHHSREGVHHEEAGAYQSPGSQDEIRRGRRAVCPGPGPDHFCRRPGGHTRRR